MTIKTHKLKSTPDQSKLAPRSSKAWHKSKWKEWGVGRAAQSNGTKSSASSTFGWVCVRRKKGRLRFASSRAQSGQSESGDSTSARPRRQYPCPNLPFTTPAYIANIHSRSTKKVSTDCKLILVGKLCGVGDFFESFKLHSWV